MEVLSEEACMQSVAWTREKSGMLPFSVTTHTQTDRARRSECQTEKTASTGPCP